MQLKLSTKTAGVKLIYLKNIMNSLFTITSTVRTIMANHCNKLSTRHKQTVLLQSTITKKPVQHNHYSTNGQTVYTQPNRNMPSNKHEHTPTNTQKLTKQLFVEYQNKHGCVSFCNTTTQQANIVSHYKYRHIYTGTLTHNCIVQ